MKMPIDIFTEIASHLMPEDIIILARSNKFFRNLLMRRSSTHVWRGAMRNVPKLPPCPPDMCEPQYLALIYSPNCSVCGGDSFKRMDEILRVRLCNSCCDSRTMSTRGLPVDVQDLVYKSSKIALVRHHWQDQSAMRGDVGAVLVKIEELKNSGDDAALGKWMKQRQEELIARHMQAAVLGAFLDHLELQEIERYEELKSKRRAEIERRLTSIGWDTKDLQLGSHNRREWEQVVNQPEIVTDLVWADIKPELVRILEADRMIRLANEESQRKSARRQKLAQILDDIKAADPPILDVSISSPAVHPASDSSDSAIQVSHQRPFPQLIDLLEYPFVKSLEETDVPASEMAAHLEEHREEIKAHVLEWRTKTEGYLAELIRKGRISDSLEEIAPAPILPVGESNPNPLDDVSDDLKLLLRADSIFDSDITSLNTPFTYDTLLSTADYLPRRAPLDMAKYKTFPMAQEAARALLAEMGKPNASFLELRNFGRYFKCGRCHVNMTRTWEALVRHYVDEQQDWERFQILLPRAQELGVRFLHAHALDTDSEKPLVQVVDSAQYRGDYYSGLLSFRCLLCMKVGLYDTAGTKGQIVEHISRWHGMAESECEEHYIETEEDSSGEESDDGYGDYGWLGGCDQGCCNPGLDSD